MTLKKLLPLPKLKSVSKKFLSENQGIFDIVIYGSLVRGKTKLRDIDLAIISTNRKALTEKLDLAQAFKTEMRKLLPYELDVRCIDLDDLRDRTFMARKGILAEGYSLTKNQPLAALFGFEANSLFVYSLENLKPSQKTTLQYAMKGRRGQKGLLASREGKQLGKGVVVVPLKHSEEFQEFFKKLKLDFKMFPALFY